jgi:hypothetical protein
MIRHLFSVSGQVVMPEFEFEFGGDYSCLYSIHRAQGDVYAVIDIKSIQKQVWNNGVATWVDDQLPMEIICKQEDRIKEQIEEQEFNDRVAAEDERSVA